MRIEPLLPGFRPTRERGTQSLRLLLLVGGRCLEAPSRLGERVQGRHDRSRYYVLVRNRWIEGDRQRAIIIPGTDRLLWSLLPAGEIHDSSTKGIRDLECHCTDRPVSGIGDVARIAVPRKLPLGAIRFRRCRIEFVQRLEHGRFAGLVPPYEGRDRLYRYPSAVVYISVVLYLESYRLQHSDPSLCSGRGCYGYAKPSRDELR